MKQPNLIYYPKQDQHKIPQVYLKCFGYRDNNNQWKVSVIRRGNTFTQQKSIKSFTTVSNLFDIDGQNPTIQRLFETGLNCKLENGYHEILDDLDTAGQFSDKSYAYLLQFVANLIARSDFWRETILSLLNSPNKERFLQYLIGHLCQNEQEYKNIHQQPFFRSLMDEAPDKVINPVLMCLMDHLMLRLWHYEVVIVQAQNEKPWFTSTNPVVAHHHVYNFEMFGKDSEFYLPLSPKYLAYLHYSGADDKTNPIRALPTNKIHLATDEQNWGIQQLILANPADYVIAAGKFIYRTEGA